MKRRDILIGLGGLVLPPFIWHRGMAAQEASMIEPENIQLTDAEWRSRLTPEQFDVMREEGTERPFTSKLLKEKRTGVYVCAACGNPLFASDTKFDSGTGWPSFYDALPGAFETRRDFKLLLPRTEYHCAKCGSHHGHVFNDGPEPTGLRYCNNGVALKFESKGE